MASKRLSSFFSRSSSRAIVTITAIVTSVLVAACGGGPASGSSGASSSSGSSSGGSPGEDCTLIGCVDGLSVSLAAPNGWRAGTYEFKIDADGALQTCKGTLPLPPCGQAGLACDNTLATITESGCALPSTGHSFPGLHFPSRPSKVTIHVERDGATLANSELKPTYQTTQPNGPKCGPVCEQASASITLASGL